MVPALHLKRTRSTPVPSSSSDDVSSPAPPRNWDKILTDGMIYLLAIGGFYVGYQTLYKLALAVDFPHDQAVVVASLVDLAILAYSRKAVQEVNDGRSAWGIRLIVAALSLATFALQIRAAWPNPTAVTLHALPPAVWVIGHEMMLRGKLRNAKSQRRTHEIAEGLRPAPLPRIRTTWWILAPKSTFLVWRLSKLWELPQETVIRLETERLQRAAKNIPRAWQGIALTTDTTPEDQSDQQKTDAFDVVLTKQSDPQQELSPQEKIDFLGALPSAPAKGRPQDQAIEYLTLVEETADRLDIKVTGVFVATLLGVDPTYISRLQKKRKLLKNTLTTSGTP
ncbi:DUF2637 domain-containing protein [Streptomyces griseus]